MTSLVQQQQYTSSQKLCNRILNTTQFIVIFFFSFWTKDITEFQKITWIISQPNCHLRFLIVVLETSRNSRRNDWQCSQYQELNHICALWPYWKKTYPWGHCRVWTLPCKAIPIIWVHIYTRRDFIESGSRHKLL